MHWNKQSSGACVLPQQAIRVTHLLEAHVT
jgi:hypothetical protein